MRSNEEIYADYLRWCMRMDLPILSAAEYERAMGKLPDQTNNVDAILRNNNKKKDKPK